MDTRELEIRSGNRQVTDLTREVEAFVRDALGDGLVNVFVPHATASLIVMETGSGSERDLDALLERLLPKDDRYVHAHGSRGHGADHLLPLFGSPSLTFPVVGGRLALGTWQSICLLDRNADNPNRRVRVSFLRS
jgi:secondary thiamine-phosphate synthase enzyme